MRLMRDGARGLGKFYSRAVNSVVPTQMMVDEPTVKSDPREAIRRLHRKLFIRGQAPSGSACINCEYCFFLQKKTLYPLRNPD